MLKLNIILKIIPRELNLKKIKQQHFIPFFFPNEILSCEVDPTSYFGFLEVIFMTWNSFVKERELCILFTSSGDVSTFSGCNDKFDELLFSM